MRGFWWKLLFAAGCALQANGASAQGVCNYNNPASPNYCTNADVSEQKTRFRSLNDDFTTNATSEADRRWRDTLLDQMRSSLSACGNDIEKAIGCEFQVYRRSSDSLQGRLEQKVRVPAELQAEAQDTALATGGLEGADPSEPLAQSESSPAAVGQSAINTSPAEPEANDSESSNDSLNNQSASSPDPIRIITRVLAILAIFLMAFRAYKGNSGIKERKFLLFSIYCSVGIIADNIWGSVGGLWFFYFPGIPIAIWGPKITAYPIRRLLLRYYGFDGPDLNDEFNVWTAKRDFFFANFRYGAIESTLSREQRAMAQLLPHQVVGICRAGVGHLETECGDCETIGCFEKNCSNYNFTDNNTCLECGHKASLRGGGY